MDNHTLRVLEFEKIVDMLVDCAVAKPAKNLAAKVRPYSSRKHVLEKLKETTDATVYMIKKGRPALSGVDDLSHLVLKAEKGGVLSPGELLKVADLLYSCRHLSEYFQEREPDEENSIYKLYQNIVRNDGLEREIKRIVVSKDDLADDASPELFSIRRSIQKTKDELKAALDRLIRSPQYAKFMQDPLVTVRNDRYVLPIKSAYKSEIKGIIHDTSASGSTVFIEPAFSVEANNKIRELMIQEAREIERILRIMSEKVRDFGKEINDNVYFATRIDFAFAKGELSFRLNCICPKISDNYTIKIVEGRHPLLDKETVVPLNIEIGERFKTLIITGPNTGGKTVALKTSGLFCLMAQAGLHVPAKDGTIMPVFNDIFCDIGDEQSIEQSLSTFSSHMKNIIHIVKNADSRSFVLLDELGAGTDPEEGSALAMSILDGLSEKGCTVIATTHYSDLKLYAIKNENMENASCEFDVESLKPTYKLIMGVPGESNALAICKRLGLPDTYIQNAKNYLHNDDIKFEEILHNIHKNKARTDRERHQAQMITKELETMKAELEEKIKRLEIEKERQINKAKEEAKRIIAAAKLEAQAVIDRLKRMEEEGKQNIKLNELIDLRKEINTMDKRILESEVRDDEENEFEEVTFSEEKSLKAGDTVKILKLNQTGTLVSDPEPDGKILVQAGMMKIALTLNDVVPVKASEVKTEPSKTVVTGVKKPERVSMEVDVRGHTVEEAIDVIDKYLDDVIMAGLHEVSIIHGKGTGALRAGIQDYLKNNPRVSSFRIGKHGEGDLGVTTVEL
jgi:DNA mismatch repair protein MutS2